MPNGDKKNSVEDTRGYFSLWAPAIGLQSDYNFTENTSLVVLGKSIIPIGTSWKYYFYGSAKVTHTFFTNDTGWFNRAKGYIGVEAYMSKSRDGQEEMQNWIEIRQGPMATVGFILNMF